MRGIERIQDCIWRLAPHDGCGEVRFSASEDLLHAMDDKVREQISHVEELPGLVGAALTMPDAHWGFGFPSAASRRSMRTTAASSRRAASASIALA